MGVERICSEIELKRKEMSPDSQHQALLGVVRKIRASLALEEIFQTTANEISQLLQVDRVGIYRFLPKEKGAVGEFVAEAVRQPYTSILGWKISDRYFADHYASCYQSGGIFVMNDLAEANLQDCHREMLAKLSLKASMVVSLLAGDNLWGLLTLHQCDRPRVWQPREVEFVEEIALHLGIAIQQAELLSQYQQQAKTLTQNLERNRVTENLVDTIRRSLDLNTIFTTATQEVRKVLEADWAAIFQFGRHRHLEQGRFLAANLPSRSRNLSLAQVDWHDWPLEPEQVGDYLAIEDVAIATNLAEETRYSLLKFQTKSLLYIPIFKEQNCWGLFCLHYFKKRVWTEYEIAFSKKIALHLGIALQQTSLLMQAKNQAESLNAVLAQAQRQKMEHQTVAQQEKALSEVIDKIRRTLDLNTIFQTTVTEVRQLLRADRSAIFQFWPPEQHQTGIFVSEDRIDPFVSLLNLPPLSLQFWDYINPQYFPDGRILAIDDTQETGIPPDVFALTPEFEVRANLLVPLFKGKNLWGLLCIHQCCDTRVWHSSEIEFGLKVALNLGIALQQAELLSEAQQRSQQLQLALAEVQSQKDEQAQLWRQMQSQSQDLESTLIDLNAIMDNLGDGLLVTDVQGNITRFNPALQSMFNLEGIDLKGCKITGYFPAELVELVDTYKRQDETVVIADVPLRQCLLHNKVSCTGQALASSIIKRAQGNEGEQCLGSVIIIRDVTKEREAERAKMNFLATVSHELRTPLTSVLGFASVIQEKLKRTVFPNLINTDTKVEKATNQIDRNLQIIVSEAERLTTLINEVLDIAKMESGNMELNIQSHSPELLLGQAIAAITPLFEQKGLALIQEFEPNLPDIAVDGDRLIQVILNLLSNALKFTEKGQVICSMRKETEGLLIRVKDTGIGVPPADQNRIFDPFQQGGNLLTEKPQGTGLGLPICKQIVESHSGRIWLVSTPGQGSEFNLIIPFIDLLHAQ